MKVSISLTRAVRPDNLRVFVLVCRILRTSEAFSFQWEKLYRGVPGSQPARE